MSPTPDDEAVRDAFVRWVSLQAAPPGSPASLIDHFELSHEYAGLLETDVQGRRVVWKEVPAASRTRVTKPASADVDPWTIESVPLRQASIHIAVCHACAGDKRIRCATCGGTGKTLCSTCNGQRKAYGHASNGAYRLLNCTLCRGKGDVECAQCKRGVAICSTCAGEGRLQRWMEIESWQRLVSKTHPQTIALQFAWDDSPTNDALERDAELLAEVDWPHQLTPDDIAGISQEWLSVLRPEIASDERIARQRLRIARVPTRCVHYRLGDRDHRVAFTGLRLLDPISTSDTAFDRRAATLRALRILLIAVAIVIAIASLARDAFFRSIPTFLSLLGCCAALIATDSAAADWTAARLHTQGRLVIGASCLVVAILFAGAALPRVGHARRLITSGQLDDAEAELRVLHGDASPSLWGDLRLARVRQATEIAAARKALDEIPRTLPQYELATRAVDQLILSTARDGARTHKWSEASAALALLSDGARGRPEAVAVAESVCVRSANESIARRDWPGASKALLAARRVGVASAALEPLNGAIRSAAVAAVANAERSHDGRTRLQQRLAAEATYVAWESAVENWGTPALIALRTAMARDVTAIEHSKRRGRAN